jgi:hypothetical protein
MPQRVAFLIGNQNFRDDSGLLPLLGPENDLAILARLLRDPERGSFEVYQFLDECSNKIMPAIARRLDGASSDDLFLIYYSGHGKLNRSGALCLATADTCEGAALNTTSIQARLLREVVEDSDCGQVVLILDCCYSGAVDLRGDVRSALQQVGEARGFHIVTATTSMQAAREAASEPGGKVLGKFTAALAYGIESGAADHVSKGKIYLSDLRRYLGRVAIGSTPQFFDRRASGDPLISLNPAAIFPLTDQTVSPRLAQVRRQAQDIAARTAPFASDRSDPKRYFDEAATLRLNLGLLQEDLAFAESGGKIVYLVDSDIVSLFLRPEREARCVVPFGGQPAENYAAPTAMITAEILFSGSLVGQHGEPLLIAPAHAEEVAAFKAWLGMAAEQETDHKELASGPINDQLRQLARKLGNGEVDYNWAAIEISGLLPSFSKESWEGAHHLARLTNERLLRPLAHHGAVTECVMSPDPTTVAEWIQRISRERLPSSSRNELGHMRDAEALAQVILMNESSDKQTRYVLVTADRSLFGAYTTWYWNTKPDIYVMRSPLQYTPILSSHEMPFSQTRDWISGALDALFADLRTMDQAYPLSLSQYITLVSEGAAAASSLRRIYGFNPLGLSKSDIHIFRQLREGWHKASREGVMLNAAAISRRTNVALEPLVEILRTDDDLRLAILENQRSTLEQIEAGHLEFTTRTRAFDTGWS